MEKVICHWIPIQNSVMSDHFASHQDGAENRDKAYSELRIFEDKLGKGLRDKHDRSYFLECHTYIYTYIHTHIIKR